MSKNIFKFIKKNTPYILSSLVMFLITVFAIFFKLIYFYVWPVKKNDQIFFFADWRNVLESSICYKSGIAIFDYNPCTILGGNPYSYGSSSLYLPFIEKYFNIYLYLFPLIMIFLIIFFINFFFKPKKFYEYFLVFFLIFSTPIMLGFERGQLELLIFIILIFVSAIKNIYLEQFLILVIASLKFYPAISYIVILTKKINTKFIFKFSIFALLTLSIFYFDREIIFKVAKNMEFYSSHGMIERMGMHIFSFQLLPECIKLTILHLEILAENKNYLVYVVYYLTHIIIILFFIYQILENFFYRNLKIDFDISRSEDKLFIMCSALIVVIYFLTQNHSYKEIYLLGLIPFLRKNLGNSKNENIVKTYYLILTKFFLLTFLWILQTTFFSHSIYIKGFNIFLKGFIDTLLISYILLFLFLFLNNFFKYNFFKLK